MTIVVRSIDQQIQHWAHEAGDMFGIRLPKEQWLKVLFGARDYMRAGDIKGARNFIFWRFNKRWQRLHDVEIAEFIAGEWGAKCLPAYKRAVPVSHHLPSTPS